MNMPKELLRKYRVNEVIFDNGNIYRAKIYDFATNEVNILTVLREIDLMLFFSLRDRIDIWCEDEQYKNVLSFIDYGYFDSDEVFFYTEKEGEKLFCEDNVNESFLVNLDNDFYKRILQSFYEYIKFAFDKNLHHGLISLENIYVIEEKIKIGDLVLGILFELNPQYVVDLGQFNEKFWSSKIQDINLDVYNVLKIIKKISDRILTYNENTELSLFVEKVCNIIYEIFSNDSNKICELFLVEIKKLLETTSDYKESIVVYRPKNLRMLYEYVSKWKLDRLRDYVIIHINHYLNDVIELNNIISSVFSKLVYVIVPYSLQTKIKLNSRYVSYYHEIKNSKYVIKKDNSEICTEGDFYSAILESIKKAFENDIVPLVKRGKKVIIVEDGGFHYSVISDIIRNYPILEKSIIGAIEQTTSGVKRYLNCKNTISYPVLSVARSKIKMRLESHFIARRVIDELNYLLYMANNFLSFHNIIIIGYGIIGRNIKLALSSMHCNITVFDIDDRICSVAKKDGLKAVSDEKEIDFVDNHIIIGATGEKAFTYQMFLKFTVGDAKKIYLASASSKRTEFQSIISFFELGYEDEEYRNIIDRITNIHISQEDYGIIYNFSYQGMDKTIVLLANGYPVNFYRKNIISLTDSIIDLIYCEMFMLLHHLLNFSIELKSKLYLLGEDELNELNVEEERLVKSWFDLLSLTTNDLELDKWMNMDIHPLEDILRDKSKEINCE